jgi:hypothetical protein
VYDTGHRQDPAWDADAYAVQRPPTAESSSKPWDKTMYNVGERRDTIWDAREYEIERRKQQTAPQDHLAIDSSAEA